jgi:hypothetical protein
MERIELKTNNPQRELEKKLRSKNVQKGFIIDASTIVYFIKNKKGSKNSNTK